MQFVKTAVFTAAVGMNVLSGLISIASYAEAANVAVDGTKTAPTTLNHYVHFPAGYERYEGNKVFPLLIVLHGIGERGNANVNGALNFGILEKVKHAGMPSNLIDLGQFKDASGSAYPFIVISPQWGTSTTAWNVGQLEDLLDYAIEHYHADPNRVYVTGLSMGGHGTWAATRAFGRRIAAIASLSAGGGVTDCSKVRHMGVWVFHGDSDRAVSYTRGKTVVEAFNACSPKHPAKLTTFKGWGHVWSLWKAVYFHTLESLTNVSAADKTHRGADGKMYSDLYRWMLTFSLNGSAAPAPLNAPPIAYAGQDRSLTLPLSSVVLTGSGEDSDGTISTRKWTQISGPTDALLSGANSPTLAVSDLVAGVYVFQYQVTDDDGASTADRVRVVVATSSAKTDYSLGLFTINIGADERGYFTGGRMYSVTNPIGNTTSDAIYQKERYGVFSAKALVPNGTYRVTLRFAEIAFDARGKRKFHVNIEGRRVLDDFDIFAAAGGKFRAVDKVFTTTVSDGIVHIEFLAGSTNLPKISGIKVEATQPPLSFDREAIPNNTGTLLYPRLLSR
jgi:poly(3-hydroxybutyrate) depolymerase